MRTPIEYARTQGVGDLFGIVLQENRAMLDLVTRLGHHERASARRPERDRGPAAARDTPAEA